MRLMPYFITNEEWFYYDEKEEVYKLTSEAPEEAIPSHWPKSGHPYLYADKKLRITHVLVKDQNNFI